MKILERIWDDIRQGENIDLYITIFAALLIAILSIFNFDIQLLLSPVTLATLAILAVSALGSRHKLEEIVEKIAPKKEQTFVDSFPKTFITRLEQTNELWFIGFSHRRVVNQQYTIIERILQRGGSVKFLFVHPDSPASSMAATKRFPRVGAKRYTDEIRNSLEQISTLKQIKSGSLEIRTTQILPSFTVFAVEPDKPSGILYLAYLPFESSSEHRPKLVLHSLDGYPYDAFRNEMFAYWENASVWEYEITE